MSKKNEQSLSFNWLLVVALLITGLAVSGCSSNQTESVQTGLDKLKPSDTCTDFEYSGWQSCLEAGVQSRTLIKMIPPGCSGGNPVQSQKCEFKKPITQASTTTPPLVPDNAIDNIDLKKKQQERLAQQKFDLERKKQEQLEQQKLDLQMKQIEQLKLDMIKLSSGQIPQPSEAQSLLKEQEQRQKEAQQAYEKSMKALNLASCISRCDASKSLTPGFVDNLTSAQCKPNCYASNPQY